MKPREERCRLEPSSAREAALGGAVGAPEKCGRSDFLLCFSTRIGKGSDEMEME